MLGGLVAASTTPALASHSLADHVKDGPAAANAREAFNCLDRGDGSDDAAVKLVWYSRGKDLAAEAIRQALTQAYSAAFTTLLARMTGAWA